MTRRSRRFGASPPPARAAPSAALPHIAHALRRAIGGSSGPFCATALLRASRSLAGVDAPTPAEWSRAFVDAAATVSNPGDAQIGERTMVDALRPAADAFQAALGRDDAAAAAASGRGSGVRATRRPGERHRRCGAPATVSRWVEAPAPHIR